MAAKKKETTEAVETNAAVEGEVVQPEEPKKMEFKLINPTEKGFLRRIEWNKSELEAAVRAKISAYENVVYTEDNMKQAKADRAELNNLVKAIEERRKKVKAIINEPYETFETELKEVTALIQEQVGLIASQINGFETQQKEAKKKLIQAVYDETIGELAKVLPFEKIFDQRYLNATYKLTDATREVKEKIERVRTDLETIDSLESKYKLNAKDVYIKTLDLSKALAENKRLTDLEEKLEADKKRKVEEEAERKRKEAEAAEKKRLEEEQRKQADAEKARQEEPAKKEWTNPVMQPMQNPETNVAEPADTTPEQQEITAPQQTPEQHAVDPFAPKQEEPPKRFRTKFCAVGTKEQLTQLIEYMKTNNIEYGRIK